MVYAMPTLFRMATPQATTITTTTIEAVAALAEQQDTMPLNIIQHKQHLARDDDYDDDNDAGEVTKPPPNLKNIQQLSDNSPIKSFNNEYARDNKGHKTRTINVTHLPNYLLHSSDNNHNNKNNINSGNKATNELQQHQSDNNKMLMTMTSSDEQIYNAQRLKILNLISNKRKRKKVDIMEVKNDEVTFRITTSLITLYKNQHRIDNNKNNFNNRDIATSSTSSTRDAVSGTNVISTTTSPSAELINNFKNFLSFKFSSSHHTAILSRTVRNARSQDPTTTITLNNNNKNSIRRTSSQSNGGNIVRRSSDNIGNGVVGLKSKRLNNSRNINNSNNKQQQTSNLDRNERSTISHLSGPARKIRLFIKNRFLQLMPDGTVNGTLSEQSDYSCIVRSNGLNIPIYKDRKTTL
ncbi:myb-like protein D [Teleopsis dalmanni]|uniref:myb-like protein D n=1 Tax=Teleopsis dalmanni TaxID=139649 RepID=UPI0018CDA10E|nr:myb-like protein D [Teleopsis dalmanni]